MVAHHSRCLELKSLGSVDSPGEGKHPLAMWWSCLSQELDESPAPDWLVASGKEALVPAEVVQPSHRVAVDVEHRHHDQVEVEVHLVEELDSKDEGAVLQAGMELAHYMRLWEMVTSHDERVVEDG